MVSHMETMLAPILRGRLSLEGRAGAIALYCFRLVSQRRSDPNHPAAEHCWQLMPALAVGFRSFSSCPLVLQLEPEPAPVPPSSFHTPDTCTPMPRYL